MAEPTWSFTNELRLTFAFMALAVLVLAGGLAAFLAWGEVEAALADVLLGAGVFLILFTALLIAPRVWGRGAMSYSLLVEEPMDAAEAAVRKALEEGGTTAIVDVAGGRRKPPSRTVRTQGGACRFILKDAPYRQTSKEIRWTEIVQTGFARPDDGEAMTLRERVAANLAAARAEA